MVDVDLGFRFFHFQVDNGNINNVRIVELINPPITTMARGFCVSEPIPVDTAAGNKPMAAINAVMTTGLILELTPVFRASTNVIL